MNGQAIINVFNSKYNNNNFTVDYMCKDIKKIWGDEMSKLINAGYGNNINIDKVVAVVNSSSAPSKRAIKNARELDLVIDATEGNKTASVIIMESGHVVLSAVKAETLRKRTFEV